MKKVDYQIILYNIYYQLKFYFLRSGVNIMAKCAICGKGPMTGNSVSHSNIKTRRVWQPNVRRIRINLNGKIKRSSVCHKCLKAGKVQKII